MSTTPKKPMMLGLPSFDEMYQALCNRDSQYEGVFVVGVTSTGIFCRPTCPARKPKPENVTFFGEASQAVSAGFRPCKRCCPLEMGGTMPSWVQEVIDEIESDSELRWTDQRLREYGVHPVRLRRWFNENFGMTFQSYQRSRRLSHAEQKIRSGVSVTSAALDSGYESLSGFRDAFQKSLGASPRDTNNLSTTLAINRIATPLGPMIAGVLEGKLSLLEFADRLDLSKQIDSLVKHLKCRVAIEPHTLVDDIQVQLREYFLGTRSTFQLPITSPGSDFQCQVWNELSKIPFGETVSYQQVAERLGKPGAQRAVGKANGSNRIAIVIPCHRVVRNDGQPGGYAGELWRKRRLLELESRLRNV